MHFPGSPVGNGSGRRTLEQRGRTDGSILNLTVLGSWTASSTSCEHPLAPALKPLVNDVPGTNPGAISLSDHFRGFMNNTSILTQPG